MKITKASSKLYRAKSVLSMIVIPKQLRSRSWVEAYSNGREQGYHINVGRTDDNGKSLYEGFSFSENRNSDDIVVYQGDSYHFNMQGNVPDEKIYANARYFPTEQQAADYISFTISQFTP